MSDNEEEVEEDIRRKRDRHDAAIKEILAALPGQREAVKQADDEVVAYGQST